MKVYLFLLGILLVSSFFVLEAEGKAPVACTMEAKICPDGSSVARVGPKCEFAPCAGEKKAKEQEPPEGDDCDDEECGDEPVSHDMKE